MLLRFSRRRHNANNGRPFSLNGQKGEGKEPRGKSTPVAHCRERSLLTALLFSRSHLFSLSLFLLLVSLYYVKVTRYGDLFVKTGVATAQIINTNRAEFANKDRRSTVSAHREAANEMYRKRKRERKRTGDTIVKIRTVFAVINRILNHIVSIGRSCW